jgi:hypothetical protein
MISSLGLIGTTIKYYISLPELPDRQRGVISLVTILNGEDYAWELVAGSVSFFGIIPFERSGLDPDQEHVIAVMYAGLERDGMGLLPLRFDGFEYDAVNSIAVTANS